MQSLTRNFGAHLLVTKLAYLTEIAQYEAETHLQSLSLDFDAANLTAKARV
jgi:hypothetical protein